MTLGSGCIITSCCQNKLYRVFPQREQEYISLLYVPNWAFHCTITIFVGDLHGSGSHEGALQLTSEYRSCPYATRIGKIKVPQVHK